MAEVRQRLPRTTQCGPQTFEVRPRTLVALPLHITLTHTLITTDAPTKCGSLLSPLNKSSSFYLLNEIQQHRHVYMQQRAGQQGPIRTLTVARKNVQRYN